MCVWHWLKNQLLILSTYINRIYPLSVFIVTGLIALTFFKKIFSHVTAWAVRTISDRGIAIQLMWRQSIIIVVWNKQQDCATCNIRVKYRFVLFEVRHDRMMPLKGHKWNLDRPIIEKFSVINIIFITFSPYLSWKLLFVII